MNRLVCSSTDAIDQQALPPRKRAAGCPARILFLHGMEVGFATTTENLIHYAAGRTDLDAVHVRLVMPRWLRLACKQFPTPIGELDYRYLRHMLFWGMHLRTLLGPGRPFPLDRFDVVHITTQQRARIIHDFRKPGRNPTGTKFAINLDATLRGWESMRGMLRLAPPLDRFLEKHILRSADVVACATRWAAGSAIDQYGVDAAKVVIHKPCARDAREHREWTPRRPRNPDEKLRLVFIGGDWIDKGGPRLVDWHQKRWADRAELHIVSGSAPPSIGALKNVKLHGRVPHEILVGDLLPTMDIFVVPTKWDTFMIAAQEAQYAGVPVVTTRTGGVSECVVHKETGFLCKRADDQDYIARVEQLMDSPVLWHTMSAAARFHASTNLNASSWHNHLLAQLVALADSRPIQSWPSAIPAEEASPVPITA